MGVYGFTSIDIEYDEETTPEEKKFFIDEIKANEELSPIIKSDEHIELHSGRIQNLVYQEDVFLKVVNKHECVYSAVGCAYIEGDCNVYYMRDDN